MQWYLSQNGKTSGPFEEERLVMMARWGKISPDAFICDKQLSAWIAIRRSALGKLIPASDESARVMRPKESRVRVVAISVLLAGVLMIVAWL